MHWLMLGFGIIIEEGGNVCLKLSDGFSRLMPSILIFLFYGLSFTAAAYAVKRLNARFVYAV